MIIIGLSAMNGFERELQSRVLSVIPHGEFEGVNEPVTRWEHDRNRRLNMMMFVAAAPYENYRACRKGKEQKY